MAPTFAKVPFESIAKAEHATVKRFSPNPESAPLVAPFIFPQSEGSGFRVLKSKVLFLIPLEV